MSGLFGRFKLASGQSTSSLPDNNKKGAGSPTNTGSKSVANLFSRKGSNDSSVDKPAVDETNADHSGASVEELQKEISKLQHTIKKYKAELDEQKRRVSEQTALNDETKQLLTASEQLEEELQKEVAALQAQLNKSLGDQEQARAEATQAIEKLRVAEKRASDTEKRLEEANAQYVAAAKVALEVTQLKAQLQTSELAKQEYEKQLHELSVEYTDFRKQVDTLAQKGDVNGIPVLLRQGTKAFIKTEEKKAEAKRRCCGAGGGKDEGGCSVM